MAKEFGVKFLEEVKRLHELGFGKRTIARSLGCHRDTVTKYLEEILSDQEKAEFTAPVVVHPARVAETSEDWADHIDWKSIRDEVIKGVTLNVLHEELVEKGKIPVQYAAFWKQLQKRAPTKDATMVRVFTPGSRIEIDYADGISIMDVGTGELLKTQLFVGVLCCSRYVFAEFTMSQKSEDFLSSHVRMFEFFGGCAQVVAPDNLKSAVTKAHRYDPVLNPAYIKLASHFGFAVVPARVRTPKDKAIVERTIQIFQRWFYMRVRGRVFTSLLELNRCLQEHLELFHKKVHRIFKRTRLEMFADERAHLMPLPKDRYQVMTHAKAMLSRDCHLVFEHNFYSAPHLNRGLEHDIWASPTTIEIYLKGERVALHSRYKSRGKFSTDPRHYPPEHQAYLEEDIEASKQWASQVGPECCQLIEGLLSGPYPLRHLRRAQGILQLSKRYSKSGLEEAAKTANRFGQLHLQFIERVIKQAQVSNQSKKGEPITSRGENPNLRGIDRIIH